jgi:hypothetical protein
MDDWWEIQYHALHRVFTHARAHGESLVAFHEFREPKDRCAAFRAKNVPLGLVGGVALTALAATIALRRRRQTRR